MPQIISKLPDVGTTIFTVMSQLAFEHNAINLGQGFPDFMMDETLMGLVYKAMKDGHNQYVHMNGVPLLRQRIAEKIKNLYSAEIDADAQITITPGGTYAIYTALTSCLQAGDEVIVFEPAYDSYIPNIEINGAVAVTVSLQFPSYSIPWDEVRSKINAKTKMIMLNSPHNPTGAVLGENDIEELKKIVEENDLYILSDEVYEHLIYDDKKHYSILLYPELMRRSFICFSFGKTYNCTGWKLGYCISAAPLMKEFRKVHQFNCFTCNAPVQYALAEFIQDKNAYLSLGNMMQQKRDYFRKQMEQTKFKLIPSHGSYFECYGYENISDEHDKLFAERLTKEHGVATIPMSAFYKNSKDDKVLRFCFSKNENTLRQAAERLIKIS